MSEKNNGLKIILKKNIYPVLTPLAIDPAHPFPQLINKALYILASLKQKIQARRTLRWPSFRCQEYCHELLKLKSLEKNKDEIYIFLSDIMSISSTHSFKATV